jgi:monoamine oxidase
VRAAKAGSNVDVLVIGAGMAGVTAARALASGGARVLVVESCDRVGGRVHTIRDFADTPVEAGDGGAGGSSRQGKARSAGRNRCA